MALHYDFVEDLASTSNRPVLIHYGVKGMKWGVRRYQNEDGTRTAEGKKHYQNLSRENKIRKYQNPDGTLNEAGLAKYKSVKDGGNSKEAKDFYKLATSPDTVDNWYSLRASVPVQHAVSKMRDDGANYYQASSKENTAREKLIRDGYDRLSKEDQKPYYDAAVNYYLEQGAANGVDKQVVKGWVDKYTEWFTNPEVRGNWQIDEDTASEIVATPYGQYYSKNRNAIESQLSDYKKESAAAYNNLFTSMSKYTDEFTKGFGDMKLSNSDSGDTVNGRLNYIVGRTYTDVVDSFEVSKVLDKISDDEYKQSLSLVNEWFAKQRASH